MNVSNQPKLIFHGVEIIKTNYLSERPYGKELDIPIDTEVIPKVFYPADNKKKFKIIMEANLQVPEYFTLGVLAMGHFELTEEITPEIKLIFIHTNAPAIMFPYLRSFISTLTANIGAPLGTLTIPTQFFSGQLEEYPLEVD